MKVLYLPEVAKIIDNLSELERARIDRIRELIESYGFRIGPKYLKKVSSLGIWELRAGKIRIFLYVTRGRFVGVHLIHKKTNKLPRNDIKLAEKRSKEL